MWNRWALVLALVLAPTLVQAQQTVVGERLRIADTAEMSGTVGHPDYVSQLTGWRIDSLGGADFRYLFTDELHAKSFIADLEQALAGAQIIAKSVAVLAANFTVPGAGGATTITLRDLPSAENMAAFQTGDTIRLRTFARAAGSLTIADAYGVVTNYADQAGGVQNWTFTRNSGADAGGMAGGTVVQADALVVDYGVSGNGFHEVNAIDGLYGLNSPYSQVVTWTTSPIAANLTVRSRIGNLRGITGTAGEYGAILGTYAATDGQYVRVSNQAVELHGVNLQMWDGATNVIKLDRTARSFAIGSPVPSGYGTGIGIWMGNDGGTYKFRVGNPAGNRVSWDGSTLAVVGNVTATTGTIGGWTISANTLTGGDVTLSSGGDITLGTGNTVVRLSDSGTYRFWVGNATATSAPFRVSSTGALTATNATLTGSLSAGGGAVDINSSGITLTAGQTTVNQIKWSDGSDIYSYLDSLNFSIDSGGQFQIQIGSGAYTFTGSGLFPPGDTMDLGSGSQQWDQVHVDHEIYWYTPPQTDYSDYPVVWSGQNTKLYVKTDGWSGSCSAASFTVENGIITNC